MLLSRMLCGAVAALAVSLPAQSSLTTTFASNNFGSVGGGIYFDLQVDVPVTIDQIDTHLFGAGTGGTIDLWTIPGGHTAGNITSTTGWTMQASATVVSAGTAQPTNAVFTDPMGNPAPFTLMPGLYGVGICANGLQHVYTNGNGPNQVYSNGDMTLTAGSAQNTCFSATPVFNPRVWNGTIYYTVASGWARWLEYGSGCPDTSASFYEVFGSNFDLSGSAGSENVIQMIFTGQDYVVTPGASAWFTPTSTPLVLADDSNSPPQMMPFSAPYPGGTFNQIIIGSNGYAYLQNGNSPGAYYWPTAGIRGFLNDGPRHCPMWGDMDPSAGGSVTFDVDPSGQTVYATWDGVPEWNAVGTFSTFQLAIHSSGMIEYRYRNCAISVAPALTGWTPGGGARDPGPIDVSAAVQAGFLTGRDASPLTLAASARPLLGQSANLEIGGIPTNTALAILFLSAAPTPPPGLSLNNAFGGMEGCFQHLAPPLVTLGVLVAPTGTGSIPINIPSSTGLAGVSIYGQAGAAIVPPAFTSSGFLSSNGLQLLLDGM